jgi:RNA polymerase subunit RPABC4/transcription elongation factor Spt4
MDTLPILDYDSKEAMIEATTSLDKLHLLLAIRKIACRDHQIDLKQWLLMGKLYLDSVGNALVCDKEESPAKKFPGIPKVLTLDEYREYAKTHTTNGPWYFSVSPTLIPNSHDTCPECGKPWTIDNFFDVIYTIEKDQNQFNQRVIRHEKCHQRWLAKKTKKLFKKIFREAGFKDFSIKATKNLYGQGPYNAPWYKVKTDCIEILIGWRSKVISIQSSHPQINFVELFSDENVTKETNLIHAWGEEKCIEYLKRIKESIS